MKNIIILDFLLEEAIRKRELKNLEWWSDKGWKKHSNLYALAA